MNKNGFTLIELLVVISIIGIIGLIAVPNMIGISENTKKDTMLNDAKKIISLAKAKVSMNYEIRNFTYNDSTCNDIDIPCPVKCNVTVNTSSCVLKLDYIDTKKEIMKDPDGESYSRNDSYVKYSKNASENIEYCIYLKSEKDGNINRVIGTTEGTSTICKKENELFSRSNVQ